MSTGGQWQGAWEGEWLGATSPAPAGSISGAASFSISGTAALTDGAGSGVGDLAGAATFSAFASGSLTKNYMPLRDLLGGGNPGHSAKQQAADDHERRISRQNQLILALVTAAITEGML
ncbi:MAG TPA: hypothetical protein PKY40_07720 [Burkholderiaceae bacterium]|nr:hypothetical protein [Burkholderiaceae bacterium]